MEWLNYHHLLYFYLVAREGGLLPASEKLHLAQSTISGQIRALEEALGEKLFVRSGRRLVLTELQSSCGPSSQLPRFAGLQGCGGPTGFVVKGAVDVDPRRAGSPGGAQRQRAGRRM